MIKVTTHPIDSTFQWSNLFETGLPEVDEQHHQLVQLVNSLGQNIESATPQQIDSALGVLTDYTAYHFQCEENIMKAEGLPEDHCIPHRAAHQRFISQITTWLEQRKNSESIKLGQLLEFLANWLVFHILGDDLAMGKQVLAIRQGKEFGTYHIKDDSPQDPRTKILLDALQRLYAGLVERNDELLAAKYSLAKLNANLEERVNERTAELLAANQQIKAEREKVIEAEKMASLGRMVAGFAHEINTPIGVAVGVLSQTRETLHGLQNLLGQDEVAEEDFSYYLSLLDQTTQLSFTSITRAAELIKSFKRTTVDQASETSRYYNLAEVIEDIRLLALVDIFKNIPIRIDVDCPTDLNLYGAPGIIVQILTNLLTNSRVHGYGETIQEGYIQITVTYDPAWISIDYSDNGKGMSAETLARAFEPFYTTCRGTGGSGLGLYIVYNLVTQGLKGTVVCNSTPGMGTQFLLRYPLILH